MRRKREVARIQWKVGGGYFLELISLHFRRDSQWACNGNLGIRRDGLAPKILKHYSHCCTCRIHVVDEDNPTSLFKRNRAKVSSRPLGLNGDGPPKGS